MARCACFALFLVACATTTGGAAGPRNYDTVIVTREAEQVTIEVTTGEQCANPRETTPCFSVPASGVEVTLRAGGKDQVLGTTSSGGQLTIPLVDLDTAFQGLDIGQQVRGQLIVHGRVDAELPIGEILDRHRVLDAYVQEVDDVLADPSPNRDHMEALWGRLVDFQMRGTADARLADRMARLYEYLHGTQGQGENVDPDKFSWAVSELPTLCKITVKGGAVVAGQLVAGPAGLALAIIAAAVGNDLSSYMIKSCCKLAGKPCEDI